MFNKHPLLSPWAQPFLKLPDSHLRMIAGGRSAREKRTPVVFLIARSLLTFHSVAFGHSVIKKSSLKMEYQQAVRSPRADETGQLAVPEP